MESINCAIRQLNLNHVAATLAASPGRPGRGVYVCDASLEDWERYVASDDHALMSRAMAWRDGSLFIVELPGGLHEVLVRGLDSAVLEATGTDRRHLRARGSTYVEGRRPLFEPDCSFGPRLDVVGATLPDGLNNWAEFHTLKVEVGVTRDWSQLDERAKQWREFPGVQYVLSIRVSPGLQDREYRLDAVCDGVFEAPRMPVTAIVAPATVVAFDSHRLVGLSAQAPLPLGFKAPKVTVDLHLTVQGAVASLG